MCTLLSTWDDCMGLYGCIEVLLVEVEQEHVQTHSKSCDSVTYWIKWTQSIFLLIMLHIPHFMMVMYHAWNAHIGNWWQHSWNVMLFHITCFHGWARSCLCVPQVCGGNDVGYWLLQIDSIVWSLLETNWINRKLRFWCENVLNTWQIYASRMSFYAGTVLKWQCTC